MMNRLTTHARALLALGLALLATASFAPAANAQCSTGVATFSYTGGEQCYTVPAGVTSLHVTAVGGAGSAGIAPLSAAGGKGANVTGLVSVTPGQTLYVNVGGNGAVSAGGFNGGGLGGNDRAGGGGGGTDIRTCSRANGSCNTLGSRLLVAGGGGGGGAAGSD